MRESTQIVHSGSTEFACAPRYPICVTVQDILQFQKENRQSCHTQFIKVKPGPHIVVTIAEHAYDHVLKRVLKLSTYRLQVLLVKYEYLRSLQLPRWFQVMRIPRKGGQSLAVIYPNIVALRRLRSDVLNPNFGNQKSALLWLKSHNFSKT